MKRRTVAARVGLAILAAATFTTSGMSSGSATKGTARTRAVAHRSDGRVVRGEAAPPTAIERVISGFAAIEPTIGFTRRGDLFYTAMRSNLELDVVRSKDRGRSWKAVSPELAPGIGAHSVGLDPYLYVDRTTSRVFTIDLTVACSYLSFSDDAGETWVTDPLGCGRPINDHQTLFAGPPVTSQPLTYPNLVYYCFNDLVTSSCAKSLDGGLIFVPTGEPAFPADVEHGSECGGLHGHGVVGNDGIVYLPREYCGAPYLAISDDEGTTWKRVRVARSKMNRQGSDPSVAVDKKGNIYYAWIAADRLPYLSVSRDGGAKWSRPMMFAAPRVQEANLVTIDVGRAGSLAYVYVGSEDSSFQRCRLGRCDNEIDGPATWNAYLGQTTTALAGDPLFYTATVNKKGDPIVVGGCGPGRCSALVDFIDVEISPDGEAWGSYVDGAKRDGSDYNRAFVGRLKGGAHLSEGNRDSAGKAEPSGHEKNSLGLLRPVHYRLRPSPYRAGLGPNASRPGAPGDRADRADR